MAKNASTPEPPEPPARTLPSGRVTLFFSDIEGSTRAWEQHPVAMPVELARHAGAVRGAIEDHAGVVVKDTGDGVFAVFGSAAEAVEAAVAAQRALQEVAWGETGPLRARIGLHTADIEPEREDYHGPPVNRCARIMGVGHGGQVLVSEATFRDLERPPADVTFEDLGLQRLRDLSVAVRVFQVLHPDLPAEFPPLRSIDVLPNNLPASLSSLVGRDEALEELAGLLGRTRLLSLTGPGGVGKTRLALQLLADRADAFTHGVWVTDLAGLSEPALVPNQIASALRIADQPGRSWQEAVEWYLRDKQVVLLLDNCEHLLDAVAQTVVALLAHCPGVTVLTTSREALDVPGEVVWLVPPLPVGESGRAAAAERLFVERAREVDPRFAPTSADQAAIDRVCHRLDGLPLAIELAAARIRVLSPAEIADRLDDRFRLLTSGRRTAMPRQRTLEAMVAWSYDLLDDPERAMFDRLSVFAGGFTLDAVEQVCVAAPVGAGDVLDLVTSLTDRSLVVHEGGDGPSRFTMLETLRAYGLDRLLQRGESARLRDAHLTWASRFARQAEPHLDLPEQRRWLDLVAAELDNIRAALDWASDAGDPTLGLGCAAALYRYWNVCAVHEGRMWLERLLTRAEQASPKVVAKALHVAGDLCEFEGDRPRARELQQQALERYRSAGNERGEAWALASLAIAEWGSVDPAAMHQRLERALEIFQARADLYGVTFTRPLLAVWEIQYGSPARALEIEREHNALALPSGIPQVVSHGYELAAMSAFMTGEQERAITEIGLALDMHRGLGDVMSMLHCLQHVAAVTCSDQPEAAARLLAAVQTIRTDRGLPGHPYEVPLDDQTRTRLLEALGPDGVAEQSRLAADLDLDAAMALAHELLGNP